MADLPVTTDSRAAPCLFCGYPLVTTPGSGAAQLQCPECGSQMEAAELWGQEHSLAPGHPRFGGGGSHWRLGIRLFVPSVAWRHIRPEFLIAAARQRDAIIDLIASGAAAAALVGAAGVALSGYPAEFGHFLYLYVIMLVALPFRDPVAGVFLSPLGKVVLIVALVALLRVARLIRTPTAISFAAIVPMLIVLDVITTFVALSHRREWLVLGIIWGLMAPAYLAAWIHAAETRSSAPPMTRRAAATLMAVGAGCIGLGLQYWWMMRL